MSLSKTLERRSPPESTPDKKNRPIVLLLGSAPDATRASEWAARDDWTIVSVNNAWRIRGDWDYSIYPDDFPSENRADASNANQTHITSSTYVPANNAYGGVFYAGGTMAFTAGYWALHALKPRVLAYLGCDMVYQGSKTHFYGKGTADPLRQDVTLRSLEAKSARLMALAAEQGCACINLSDQPDSRLVFPRVPHNALHADIPLPDYHPHRTQDALDAERHAGYFAEDGRYWKLGTEFDPDTLDKIDRLWLSAVGR